METRWTEGGACRVEGAAAPLRGPAPPPPPPLHASAHHATSLAPQPSHSSAPAHLVERLLLVGALVARQVAAAGARVEEPLALVAVVLVAVDTRVGGARCGRWRAGRRAGGGGARCAAQDQGRAGGRCARPGASRRPRPPSPTRPAAHPHVPPARPFTDSPARQHHRLRAHVGLARDAGHVREVGAPLPAVQPVLPPLAHADALQGRGRGGRRGAGEGFGGSRGRAAGSPTRCRRRRPAPGRPPHPGAAPAPAQPSLGLASPAKRSAQAGSQPSVAPSQPARQPGRRTVPRGSASAGMGPKWSLGMLTMMRPAAGAAAKSVLASVVLSGGSGRWGC